MALPGPSARDHAASRNLRICPRAPGYTDIVGLQGRETFRVLSDHSRRDGATSMCVAHAARGAPRRASSQAPPSETVLACCFQSSPVIGPQVFRPLAVSHQRLACSVGAPSVACAGCTYGRLRLRRLHSEPCCARCHQPHEPPAAPPLPPPPLPPPLHRLRPPPCAHAQPRRGAASCIMLRSFARVERFFFLPSHCGCWRVIAS